MPRPVRTNALLALTALGAAAAAPASAMPAETATLKDVPGVTEQGVLDIRDVLDNATAMEVRLTRQLMLLQRQIIELDRRIDVLQPREDKAPSGDD